MPAEVASKLTDSYSMLKFIGQTKKVSEQFKPTELYLKTNIESKVL